ncbi:MAG: cytochrome c oxidase subunit II [Candidatus Omnitrophica bacterium]|nr:cytochrome c oxidase subunit II [Candidatus Omnitrophota bacterium]
MLLGAQRQLLAWLAAAGAWLVVPAAAWAGAPVRIWLPEAVTTSAPLIDRLFYTVLAITGAAFVLVQGALLFFVWRYRHRPDRRAAYTHGNTLVEVVWTAVPTLILVVLAVYNQQVWSQVRGTPLAPDLQVEVTGEQFAWNIRYPGQDGRLNTADDLLTINQMHLPVRQTVLIHLKSKDVIHSFFVPQFRVKQDAVPGMTTRLWVSATKTGQYEIACAELCGLGHYRMRGFLTLESPDEFARWLIATAEEQAS